MALGLAAGTNIETINLTDGTKMYYARAPDMTDEDWKDFRDSLVRNPAFAHETDKASKDPNIIRKNKLGQIMWSHYAERLDTGDYQLSDTLEGLQTQDKELARLFEEIQEFGVQSAADFDNKEAVMAKISKSLGGVPEELLPELEQVYRSPHTVHEACKLGDIEAVNEWIRSPTTRQHPEGVDELDHKHITPLSYAIAGNHADIVGLLLESKANPSVCDRDGNTGAHYAAGYGRPEILRTLLEKGVNAGKSNKKGQNAVDIARQNKQDACKKVIEEFSG